MLARSTCVWLPGFLLVLQWRFVLPCGKGARIIFSKVQTQRKPPVSAFFARGPSRRLLGGSPSVNEFGAMIHSPY